MAKCVMKEKLHTLQPGMGQCLLIIHWLTRSILGNYYMPFEQTREVQYRITIYLHTDVKGNLSCCKYRQTQV